MKKTKKVILIGSFSGGNYGDTLILFALIKFLTKKNVDTIVIPSSNPDGIKKFLTENCFQCDIIVESINMKKTFGYRFCNYNVIKHVSSSDSLIFTAGTLFFRDLLNPRKNFIFSVLLLLPLLKLYSVKLKGLFVGVNEKIEEFHFLKNLYARKSLKHFHQIITRDEITYNNLKNSRIDINKLETGFDIALYDLLSDKRDFSLKKSNPLKKVLGINICKYLGHQVGIDVNINELIIFIIKLSSEFDTVYCFNTTKQDKIFILEKLQFKCKNIIHIDLYQNTNEVKHYKKLSLFIGMRMHSLIPAIAYKIPCCGLNYNNKVRDLFKMMNAEASVFDLDEINKLDYEMIISNSFVIQEEKINQIIKRIDTFTI